MSRTEGPHVGAIPARSPAVNVPFSDNYSSRQGGDVMQLYVLGCAALLILLAACFNFVNLATARAADRAREVGLRKVLGAGGRQLVFQFMAESLVFCFVALGAALAMAALVLPRVDALAGLPLGTHFARTPAFLPAAAAAALIIGLAAGLYPSLMLARFRPAGALAGALKPQAARTRLRRALVFSQLAAAVFLMIGTRAISRQTSFMKNEDPGFAKDHVVVLPIPEAAGPGAAAALKDALHGRPGVMKVAVSSHVPGQEGLAAAHLPEGFALENAQIMRAVNVDADFLETMGIGLASGRNFSPDRPGDPRDSALINETAARRFGWEQPLGKTIRPIYGDQRVRTVIGVVKDVHWASFRTPIEPLFITGAFPEVRAVSVRIEPGNIPAALALVRSAWKSAVPQAPFDCFFLDAAFDAHYRAEETFGRVMGSFSLLTVFVACLGLFGTAAHAAVRRTREIGIRKALGASGPGIALLLSRELLGLFAAANLVAWPAAYLASRQWLQGFPYRASLGIWVFLAPALLALAFSAGAVAVQTIKAANSNPVDALRYE